MDISQTMLDQLGSRRAFLIRLAVAELFASNAWEIQFTKDMRDLFDRDGDRMTMTDLQRKQLNRIAGF